MRRLTHLIVLVAFIFSCGGQWCLLQGVAWVKMIHDYAQVVPLSEAVSMTFSGKYPCAMCRAIAEKKADEDRGKVMALEKYDKKFIPPCAVAPVERTSAPILYTVVPSTLELRAADSPPTPPPRLALA